MEESSTAVHVPRKDQSSPPTELMTSPIENDASATPTTWQTKRTIFHRISIRITPPLLLFLAVLCLMLTGYASWSCSFVTHDAPSADAAVPPSSVLADASFYHNNSNNSSSSFTNHDNNTTNTSHQQEQQHHYRISSSYGLWTLQDDTTSSSAAAQCHLWYVFFVGAQLDGWIKLAQSCSMTAQVIGLMVTVGILQQQCRGSRRRWYRYGVGALWVALVVASIATRQQFNSWTLFFGSTYLVLLWLVPPSTTTTPVSARTTTTTYNPWPHRLSYAALTTGCLALLATISMRQSAVCTCSTMVLPLVQGQALEFGACDNDDDNDGDTESLRSLCRLGRAGWVMVASGLSWTVLGVLLRLWCSFNGQQQEQEHGEDEHMPRCKRRSPAISAYAYNAEDNDDDEAQCNTTGCIDDDDDDDDNPKLTGRQRCRLYSYRLCLGMFLLSYLAIILLLVFSHRQNNQAAKLPDTSANFLTDTVCAFQPTNPFSGNNNDNAHQTDEFVTFPSKEQALAAGYQVAHCGACGYCSNPSDITTYINTRTTIADTAKTCGKYTVMGRSRWYDSESSSSSSSSLYDCLEDRIGFTPECTQCWVDNMKTTARRCMMTCVSTVLNGLMGQNNMETVLGSTTTATTTTSASESSSHWMNQCFFCDEKQSGPAFVQCSGVARRRLGIASEISRDPREQCTAVDWDWTKVKLDTLFGDNGGSESTAGHDTSV